MAKSKVTKFRLPQGKILQFTPRGKAVPIDAKTVEDDKLLAGSRFRYVSNPDLRGAFLAQIKGGDEAVRKYIERFL